MGYKFLEDVAIADVAFEAWGQTPEELFTEAARATSNVMIRNLDSVRERERKDIHISAQAMDLLLFSFLQEVIYYKDAERLILANFYIKIHEKDGEFELTGAASGEKIDIDRHVQIVDVKAVTFHRFQVVQNPKGWSAFVILDI